MSSKPVLLRHPTGEQDAIRLISDAGLPVEICTFVRAVKADIDYAADNGADSVHLVIPVSDLHIEKKMRKTRDAGRGDGMEFGRYAKSRGLIVELSGEDASRADQVFLLYVFTDGVERGADRLCFCDTVGVLTPEKIPGSSSRRLPKSHRFPSTAMTISALHLQTRSLH